MDDMLDTPIEDLNLSVRAYNCLKRSGLMTIRQLLPLGEADFLALRNFGRRSYDEVMERLAERGFGGPAPEPGLDEPDGPDEPDASGDRVPRRPSPGGLVAAAEAIPERRT
jgi:DNA-directed RNA polymerase subunit alpha